MIRRIMPESYLPVNYVHDKHIDFNNPQRWNPQYGQKVTYRGHSYVIIDTWQYMDYRSLAMVRIYKNRDRIFPLAFIRFIKSTNFHKLPLFN